MRYFYGSSAALLPLFLLFLTLQGIVPSRGLVLFAGFAAVLLLAIGLQQRK
jgi:hypothetical protein